VEPKSENMAESVGGATQKEWRQPELRRLPIAATANSNKPGGNTNDSGGGGAGKGEVQPEIS
jgi:hypothetical protein